MIDKDGLIENAEHCVSCGAIIPEGMQVCVICGLKAKYKQPTADVVEVVRCKDCVYCCISTDPKTNISIQKCGYVGFNPVRDRLIKLLCKAPLGFKTFENQYYKSTISKIADYLIANGVIVPPCKVGAEIFGVFDNDDEQRKEIYEGKVLCFSLDENNLLWAKMRYKNGLTYWHTIDDFGKTVFLTKEEAEKALERSKDNETNI